MHSTHPLILTCSLRWLVLHAAGSTKRMSESRCDVVNCIYAEQWAWHSVCSAHGGRRIEKGRRHQRLQP